MERSKKKSIKHGKLNTTENEVGFGGTVNSTHDMFYAKDRLVVVLRTIRKR